MEFKRGLIICDYSGCSKAVVFEDAKRIPLKTCSNCHSTSYCDSKCQVADWPSHKQQCKSLAACRYARILTSLPALANIETGAIALLHAKEPATLKSVMKPSMDLIRQNALVKSMLSEANEWFAKAWEFTDEVSRSLKAPWAVFVVRKGWFAVELKPVGAT